MTPEQKLWRAVLGRALQDADGVISDVRPDERELLIHRAKNWLNSRDYNEVCVLAGAKPKRRREH